jgi:hypothetical protein
MGFRHSVPKEKALEEGFTEKFFLIYSDKT